MRYQSCKSGTKYALSLYKEHADGKKFPKRVPMPQEICIIHANCQGDNLQFLLSATPAFAQKFVVHKYTNYLHESIDEALLQKCSLFLYQELGGKWGDLSSHNLIQKLSQHAHFLQIPNMFFNGYWPLWTNATFMAYGDVLLEDLCSRGLSAQEILHIYTRGALLSTYDLEGLRQESHAKELAKEQNLSIKTLPFIEELWQEEQLFYTVNHPAPRLTLYVADAILQHLGLGCVPQSVRALYMAQQEEFIQPIHPHIAAKYNLAFGSVQRLYPVYGQEMTFAKYINAYIHCRLQSGEDSVKDFVVYLHLLAERAKKTCAA